jgi:hypothetical protein
MLPLRGLLAAALTIVAATNCGLAEKISPKPLTVARKLEGVWKTAIPVTFYYQTDFCGAKQNVATAKWDVTWTVTAQDGFENAVDIEMRFTRTGSTAIAGNNCGSGANGWVPLVSPTFLEATMSSTSITAYDEASGINAFGSFTSDLMMLTWVHNECIIYCSGEVTASQELKLVRQ